MFAVALCLAIPFVRAETNAPGVRAGELPSAVVRVEILEGLPDEGDRKSVV